MWFKAINKYLCINSNLEPNKFLKVLKILIWNWDRITSNKTTFKTVNKQLKKVLKFKETYHKLVTDKNLQIRDLETIETKNDILIINTPISRLHFLITIISNFYSF